MSITNWFSSNVSPAFPNINGLNINIYQQVKTHQIFSINCCGISYQHQIVIGVRICSSVAEIMINYSKIIANTDSNYSIDSIGSGFEDMLAGPVMDDRANGIAGILMYQSCVEYTNCTTHYNVKQMWECFVSMHKRLCYCGTTLIVKIMTKFDQRWCYECGERDIPNLLNVSFNQLFHRICCENENEFLVRIVYLINVGVHVVAVYLLIMYLV